MRKRHVPPLLLLCFFCTGISAQQQTIWSAVNKTTENPDRTSSYKVSKKKTYTLNMTELRKKLQHVPLKNTNTVVGKQSVTLAFPVPGGVEEPFTIYETPVMEATWGQKHDNIRSYTGVSPEKEGMIIKFTLTDFGFHGMIFSPTGTISYINPEDKEHDLYEVFSRDDLTGKTFGCLVTDAEKSDDIASKHIEEHKAMVVDDGNLRTFRLALAATAEYTQFHANAAGVGAGTDEEKRAAALAAMIVTMTRVNGIFEREVGITMEIVPNESIIFTDANTDGLTNDNGGVLINEIQSVIDNNIGSANYDIGHVFSTGGGGIAQLASPCVSGKARGVTGLSSPVGDPFDVDFVSHEIGHQYGATHTFNNFCGGNRTGVTAVEPGSGSTIMSYAGICPDNVQFNADDYFHTVSIQQMWANITVGNSTCAALTLTGNTAPVADAGNDYTIPPGTPFVLEGQGTDADGDMLTYCWEQIDNQITVQPPQASSTGGPLFRSIAPDVSPNRYLPGLPDILSGNLSPTWEVLPEVSREINFSLLVRDNNASGGQTASDNMVITVDDSKGPFTLTSQATEEVWEAGEVHTITWDVAATDLAPVNATHVTIFLYTDTQFENAVTLADNVFNDGSHNIVVPGGIDTTTGRIMVRPVNNIFFAVNAANITVVQTEYVLTFDALEQTACQPDDVVFSFTYNTYLGFSDQTDFTVTGVPPGLVVNFNPVSAIADDTVVDVTVTGTDSVAEGHYTFTIQATSGGLVRNYEIALTIYDSTFDDITLLAPADTATGVYTDTPLEWQAVDFTETYDIEVSDTPDFLSIVESATVTSNTYSPANLQEEITYYWRVKPVNSCGEGTFSPASSFTTTAIDCRMFTNDGTVAISTSGTPVITSYIAIADDLPINSIAVSLDITHTYAEDLRATLTSPSGTVVNLFSNLCGSGDNINATFIDTGDSVSCGFLSPVLSGTLRPEQLLSAFRDETAQGEWVLTIYDDADLDGGSLNSFALNVCVNGIFPPDSDSDGVADVDDLCPGTPLGEVVNTDGCTVFSLPADNFTINITGESCIPSNDGSISVMATEALNYQATLTGPGVDIHQDFTDTTNFIALNSGTYMLCITVDGIADYQQCYEINVVQPAPLTVQSKINTVTKSVTVLMEGGTLYNVELNGVTTQTETGEITLPLKEGINTLRVTTDKDCQGVYEENIIIGNPVRVYPNPVSGTTFTIDIISQVEEAITVDIYSISGKRIYKRKLQETGVSVIVDAAAWPSGVYLISITGKHRKTIQKIVKL